MTERIYIHEIVDIIGDNRPRYMDRVCDFAPTSRAERGLSLFGVWGAVGSTTRWPTAINLWETRDWLGMGANFAFETGHPALHDPSLKVWIEEVKAYRSGGLDRLLVAADFTPDHGALLGDDRITGAAAFHHEVIATDPGSAPDVLRRAHDLRAQPVERLGGALVGAFTTAMTAKAEALLIWALPDWPSWAAFQASDQADDLGGRVRAWSGILMCSAPRSPLKTGQAL